MSDKLPQQPQNEEIDLGQLFNAIGKVFEKFFAFIGSIFKAIFSAIIYILKPLIENLKLVVITLFVMIILGFVLEKTKKPSYSSKMIVETHFDSKYQLVKDVGYFNNLIQSDNFIELSNIFKIDSSDAKELKSFDLIQGPETPNDLFIEYGDYLKNIDTSLVEQLSYKEYVINRDLLSGNRYTIKAEAFKQDIFLNLTDGFRKTFENDFSKHKKQVRDTIVYIQNLSYNTELTRLDSLQKTYVDVLKNESNNKNVSLALNTVIPLQQEKTVTKEYELFIKEQEIRRDLYDINSEMAEENTYYDIISSFDRLGSEDPEVSNRYYFVLPILTLIIFVIGFLFLRAINFIKNYE